MRALPLIGGLLAAALSLGALVQDEDPAPPKSTFWLLAWPDAVLELDPETDEVISRVETRWGLPHGAQLNRDQSEMWLITNRGSVVEVLDIEKKEIVEDHDFSEPNWIIRVETVREVPGGTHWWVEVERVERKLDHYVIHDSQWWYYDRVEGEVEKREKEMPREIRRARISEDGTRWRVGGSDITYLNAESYEEEVKIDLTTPRFTGMGGFRLSGEDLDRGRNWPRQRYIYTMRDPVRRERSLMGVLTLDVEKGEVVEYTEWGASMSVWGWRVTQDATRAVGQKGGGWGRGGGEYGRDPEMTLVTMDLTTGRLVKETRITVRNGLRLAGISPRGDKIYLAGRGHDVHVYDADHGFLGVIDLEGETEGRLFVVDR